MTLWRKQGFGISEVLIAMIVASTAVAIVAIGVHTQGVRTQMAQFKAQMGMNHNSAVNEAQKFSAIDWGNQLETLTYYQNIQACLEGNGTSCDQQPFANSVNPPPFTPYPNPPYPPATLTIAQKYRNSLFNGFYSLSGTPCGSATAATAQCPVQQSSTLYYECGPMLCTRGIVQITTSVVTAVLPAQTKNQYASVPPLSSRVVFERVENAGILRTLASSCQAAEGLNEGTGNFTCAATDGSNTLFASNLGYQITNGQLQLEGSAGGSITPGGTGGTSGGTTGSTQSSSASCENQLTSCPAPYQLVQGTNGCNYCECPSTATQVMNNNGTFTCQATVINDDCPTCKWAAVASACSKSCGGGTSTVSYVCKNSAGAVQSDGDCTASYVAAGKPTAKPAAYSEACNTQRCCAPRGTPLAMVAPHTDGNLSQAEVSCGYSGSPPPEITIYPSEYSFVGMCCSKSAYGVPYAKGGCKSNASCPWCAPQSGGIVFNFNTYCN